jgi:ferric-dicitrate binding protein FerR (iron transport regulator)
MEEIAFRKEIQSNPKQQIELKTMEKSWKYFDENPSRQRWDSSSAWNHLQQRLDADGLLEESASERATGKLLPLLRIAASIMLVLAIGIPALYFGVIRSDDGEALKTHYAENGVHTVDLPDGSRVFLNEGAEIAYAPVFKQERSVKLNGEAFFEVMSDPANPFTVHSGKVVISVLGTSFNVKNKKQSIDTEVYVKTGRVRMALEESDQFITLQAEEMGLSSTEELSKRPQEDPNYISWKTKDFKFVDAELREVLMELEESYHVKIHAEGVNLSDMKITTSYRSLSIDAILETIGTAFGMNVSSREDGYYLTN